MMSGSEGWGWGIIDGFGWNGLLAVCLIVVGIITFFALRGRNS